MLILASRADDDLMTRVGWLRDLEVLSLHGNKDVTDIGLAHLKGLGEAPFPLSQCGTGVDRRLDSQAL